MGNNSDVIYDSGFSTPVTKVCLQDVPNVAKIVCFHTVLLRVKAELDQIADGLRLFNVLDLIRHYS